LSGNGFAGFVTIVAILVCTAISVVGTLELSRAILMKTLPGFSLAPVDGVRIAVVAVLLLMNALSDLGIAVVIRAQVAVIALPTATAAPVKPAVLAIALGPAVNAVAGLGFAGIHGDGDTVIALSGLHNIEGLALELLAHIQSALIEDEALRGTVGTQERFPSRQVDAVLAVLALLTALSDWLCVAAAFDAYPLLARSQRLAAADLVEVVIQLAHAVLAGAAHAFNANETLGARERTAPIASHAGTTGYLKAFDVGGVGVLAFFRADLADGWGALFRKLNLIGSEVSQLSNVENHVSRLPHKVSVIANINRFDGPVSGNAVARFDCGIGHVFGVQRQLDRVPAGPAAHEQQTGNEQGCGGCALPQHQ